MHPATKLGLVLLVTASAPIVLPLLFAVGAMVVISTCVRLACGGEFFSEEAAPRSSTVADEVFLLGTKGQQPRPTTAPPAACGPHPPVHAGESRDAEIHATRDSYQMN
jgi:hypothetical protein